MSSRDTKTIFNFEFKLVSFINERVKWTSFGAYHTYSQEVDSLLSLSYVYIGEPPVYLGVD